MTLYEIDQRILDLVDPETGDITDVGALDALLMERKEKLENIALWHKNLLSDAKQLKDEIDKLTKRRQQAERTAARLLTYLEQALDGEKLSTARVDIGYRKSTALEVNDLSAAAKWLEKAGYVNMVFYDPHIDKRAVAALVKDGTQVPGVELSERRTMQVR